MAAARIRRARGSPTPSTPTATHAPTPRAPTAREAWIARVVAPVTALRESGRGRVVARLKTHAAWNGGPVGLLVLATRERDGQTWLKVRLPTRPNDATGWIPSHRTDLRLTSYRIVVDLSDRRVRLLFDGRTLQSSAAVIGKPGTPTPTGLFAVAERVRQSDPRGFLGPWALHLTAHSDVLDDYGGGPGRVALHGRDGESLLDPLGSAASHGCVRLPNAFVSQLARSAREGTPVEIRRQAA